MSTPPKRRTDLTDHFFGDWIRNNLPHPNTGLNVSDIDYILYNYKSKKLMLLEIKCQGQPLRTFQKYLFTMLNEMIRDSLPRLYPKYRYLGFNVISFENDRFNNGKVYFNNKEISESELIEKLSI